MTKIKKFWIALITAILCLATFAFAGCNKGGGNTDGGDVFDDTTGYVFVIEDQDGNPLSGYVVYLCASKADGGACGALSKPSNQQGKLTASAPLGLNEGSFEIHLLNPQSVATSYTGATVTPTTYCTITLIVTL